MRPLMGKPEPREWLGLAALLCLAAGFLAGVAVVSRSVRSADLDLLRSETTVAARFAREPQSAVLLERLFPGRWRLEASVDPMLGEAVVERRAGSMVGRAAVYDADAWDVVGTIQVSPRDSRAWWRSPAGGGALALAMLMVASGWRWVWAGRRWDATRARIEGGTTHADGGATPAPAEGASAAEQAAGFAVERVGGWHVPRPALSFFAVATLGLAFVLLARSARHELRQATGARLDLAAVAVQLAPEPRGGAAARAWDAASATGLIPVIAGVPSVIPPGAIATLTAARIGTSRRVEAARVDYAVVDTSLGRLAMVPYEHTWDPGPALVVVFLATLVLAALPASLMELAARPRALRANLTGWGFVAPAFAHLLVFTLGPALFAFWLSFARWSPLDAARPFVGLDNYRYLLEDAAYRRSLLNTVVFTLHVPVSMALALGLALLVVRRTRATLFARSAFFVPGVVSLAAVGMVWQWLLHEEYGLVNAALHAFGLAPVRWLASPGLALVSLMLVTIWTTVGYQMLVFLAGLSAIPAELYDAARIDGASRWQRFRAITLPGLRHTSSFLLITSLLGSFQAFGTVYVMTGGGPLHATDLVVFHIYREAWVYFRFGSAAAMSLVVFVLLLGLTWLHFRVVERRAVEAGS